MERSDQSFSKREQDIRDAIAEARAERERLERDDEDTRPHPRQVIESPQPASPDPSPA